ncbi:MAG: nucleotidyl transferase AbiEii/AbiGii toxin family protein [Gammaproteobacteria bacterium]|nr:nucleotidyl transferase AbiEii/AbiGii toxin family protein [Gammaproteobacteria bacterium]MBU1408678.1 nucleotidyl transferase AbiEii/AbiGii toxin family protein [Gammaproteobacteria bacterium]MBU1532490.1 nucleotidyl transferase AbiEii/AbiGii toxin family protein [Gammaproteobacteria bacterium]
MRGKIAFRGGTAINKLLFTQPLRYSEDIDLVQTQAEPIGKTVDAIRDALSWLGKCKREQAGHSMHLVFKFTPEADSQATLKLKVEINTREHEHLLGIRPYTICNGKRVVSRQDRDRILRARRTVRHQAARASAAAQEPRPV